MVDMLLITRLWRLIYLSIVHAGLSTFSIESLRMAFCARLCCIAILETRTRSLPIQQAGSLADHAVSCTSQVLAQYSQPTAQLNPSHIHGLANEIHSLPCSAINPNDALACVLDIRREIWCWRVSEWRVFNSGADDRTLAQDSARSRYFEALVSSIWQDTSSAAAPVFTESKSSVLFRSQADSMLADSLADVLINNCAAALALCDVSMHVGQQ